MCFSIHSETNQKTGHGTCSHLQIGAGMVMREVWGGRQIGPESVSLSRDGGGVGVRVWFKRVTLKAWRPKQLMGSRATANQLRVFGL